MQNELYVDSITKEYNNKIVLKNIFLKVNSGDIIGLLGRNGCGKSTLLKIIFGTVEAESKFIRVNGTVYNNAYKNNRIKLLPQESFIPKHLKVKYVLKLYCKNIEIEKIKNDEIIKKIYNTKIKDISGGELRYLEIMLLMYLDTNFLLLDEPFNAVSPIIVEEMKKKIIEYSKEKGIILTDHDYRNVLSVSNKIYIMKNGSIKELKNSEELIEYGYIPNKQTST